MSTSSVPIETQIAENMKEQQALKGNGLNLIEQSITDTIHMEEIQYKQELLDFIDSQLKQLESEGAHLALT